MKKFNSNQINNMKKIFEKSQYMKRNWKTDQSCIMTLQDYAEMIDSQFKSVTGNPIIIAKERTDGNIFLKMWIPLGTDSGTEFDLSYQRSDPDYDGPDFEEGDEIDKDSLRFCIERFLDKSHGYVTGEIL